MTNRKLRVFIITAALLTISAAGCQKAYYNAMEKIGFPKRDILIDRVEEAKEAQEDAKEQFKSALDKFRSVIDVKGGDLEDKYDQLNSELDDSKSRAKEVRDRIASVEDVAGALFDEWEEELEQYNNQKLKNESRRNLNATKKEYNTLIKAMKRAEAKIDPVLKPLSDQVLFLKHNLNARAIASLEGELTNIQSDVSSLVKDMERSIKEADEFIKSMNKK